jgi:Alpha/beta hydrolase domain
MAPSSRGNRDALVAVLALALLGLAACSSSSKADHTPPATAGASSTPAVSTRKPTVAAATLSGPITTGQILPPAALNSPDLRSVGYTEEEFFAAGTATAYTPDGNLGPDGVWEVKPSTTAAYKTRLVVRRPSDPAKFDGTVVVEWLNETIGADAAPDWTYYGAEIRREGAVYVGLSAQSLGINGGQGALAPSGAPPSGGLKAQSPERYGSLVHPGDQYSYDILSQVGAAVRAPGGVPVLGPLQAARVVASGESQSAFFLTTYLDALQPVANAFDGFFIHSRAGAAAPLDGSAVSVTSGMAAKIRTDLDAPVMIFETETDVGPTLGYTAAVQDDTPRLRVWEVAGTAHADQYLVGPIAAQLGCLGRINEGPHHYVADAAFAALERWITDGTPPPEAPRIQTSTTTPATVARDAAGIATGGIRTPPVDAPTLVLSGDPAAGASGFCTLVGTTTPLTPAAVEARYATRDDYLNAFDRSLADAIAKGFVLDADRAAFAAEARAFPFPS